MNDIIDTYLQDDVERAHIQADLVEAVLLLDDETCAHIEEDIIHACCECC